MGDAIFRKLVPSAGETLPLAVTVSPHDRTESAAFHICVFGAFGNNRPPPGDVSRVRGGLSETPRLVSREEKDV